MFDGKVPHWYHFSCFWKVGHTIWQPDVEVDGFSELRWDDQQKVKKTAEAGGVTGTYTAGRQQVLPPTPELTGNLCQESKEKVLQLAPPCFTHVHTGNRPVLLRLHLINPAPSYCRIFYLSRCLKRGL